MPRLWHLICCHKELKFKAEKLSGQILMNSIEDTESHELKVDFKRNVLDMCQL